MLLTSSISKIIDSSEPNKKAINSYLYFFMSSVIGISYFKIKGVSRLRLVLLYDDIILVQKYMYDLF